MLLVLTSSIDGTANLLFEKLQNSGFRFNVDIFKEYDVELKPDFWSIENPAGLKITSETATGAFWWKVTNYEAHQDSFIDEEVKYVFREIYNWFLHRNLIKGQPPDYHKSNGKISILSVAKKYFNVPDTYVGWGFKQGSKKIDGGVVAKSLSSGLTATNRALFTTEVSQETLNPEYPWYLQTKLPADFDTTTFICGQKFFTFRRSRKNLKGLDWRNEQDFASDKEWDFRELSLKEKKLLEEFCKEMKIDWGRIDFMELDNELTFLEYNANGQWVFLDYRNEIGLVDEVVKYLTNKN
jgi:hypothetical protein